MNSLTERMISELNGGMEANPPSDTAVAMGYAVGAAARDEAIASFGTEVETTEGEKPHGAEKETEKEVPSEPPMSVAQDEAGEVKWDDSVRAVVQLGLVTGNYRADTELEESLSKMPKGLLRALKGYNRALSAYKEGRIDMKALWRRFAILRKECMDGGRTDVLEGARKDMEEAERTLRTGERMQEKGISQSDIFTDDERKAIESEMGKAFTAMNENLEDKKAMAYARTLASLYGANKAQSRKGKGIKDEQTKGEFLAEAKERIDRLEGHDEETAKGVREAIEKIKEIGGMGEIDIETFFEEKEETDSPKPTGEEGAEESKQRDEEPSVKASADDVRRYVIRVRERLAEMVGDDKERDSLADYVKAKEKFIVEEAEKIADGEAHDKAKEDLLESGKVMQEDVAEFLKAAQAGDAAKTKELHDKVERQYEVIEGAIAAYEKTIG